MLRFQTEAIPPVVRPIILADYLTVQEVTCIQLNSRLSGIKFQNSAGNRLINLSAERSSSSTLFSTNYDHTPAM